MKKTNILLLIAAIALQWAFISPVQVLPTNLKITVRNELGNAEDSVSVQLFVSREDYEKEENPVTEVQMTDKKGAVKFRDLQAKEYYILAVKGEMNNYGAGAQTDKLEPGKLNKVTIIVE